MTGTSALNFVRTPEDYSRVVARVRRYGDDPDRWAYKPTVICNRFHHIMGAWFMGGRS